VQAVQQEQAADHLVPSQRLDQGLSRLPGLVQDLQEPLKGRSVEAEERLDRSFGRPPRLLVRESLEVPDQGLRVLDPALEVLLLQGPPPSTGMLGLSGSMGFLDSGSIPVV
jgi:hypothetical protein